MGSAFSSAEDVGYPVHIEEQIFQVRGLHIVPVGVKVRRAVRIREVFWRKGMGDKDINASYQHKISQPFHGLCAFRPAVIAEDLTHGASLFLFVKVGVACAQFSEGIMVEFPVGLRIQGGVCGMDVFASGKDLGGYHVDTRHILSGHGAEIVSGTGAEAGRGVVVLQYMAYVFHPVGTAPVTQLQGEILFVKPGDRIHIPVAESGVIIG